MAKVHYWILESTTFWWEIIEKEHKREAESLQELKREQNKVIIKGPVITVEMVKIKSRRIPNWKAPRERRCSGLLDQAIFIIAQETSNSVELNYK